jgi:hypothetical protein
MFKYVENLDFVSRTIYKIPSNATTLYDIVKIF